MGGPAGPANWMGGSDGAMALGRESFSGTCPNLVHAVPVAYPSKFEKSVKH